LENLVHQDQKDHKERMETLALQENKDLLETQENAGQGVQLENPEAQDLKVYLEWKVDQVLWVHQVHLVLLATPYQLPQQQCLEEKLFLGFLDHRDLWDHQVLLVREELQVEEDQREEGDHLDHQALLVVREDKVFQEEQEIQDHQAKMAVQGELILKMI